MEHTAPLPRLRQWIDTAAESGFPTPASATLATVDSTGQPSTRIITIRDITETSIRFATTLYTRKAMDIQHNHHVSLLLFWPDLGQVHLAGEARIAPRSAAEEIFASRGKGGQLRIHATRQGEPITSIDIVKERIVEAEKSIGSQPLKCPEDWGAIDIHPHTAEFWRQGKAGLHERHLYRRTGDRWTITQLCP